MALRKAFSGDRETAVEYFGLAKAKLDQLKGLMQLGGLQQLQRRFVLPNGVVLEVACVFGQEYISIYAPPLPAAEQVLEMEVVEREEQVTTEYVPERISDFIEKTFADTTYARGSCTIEMTRKQDAEIVIVGYSTANGTYDSRRAFRWSSVGGMVNLGVGAGGYASEAHGISPNGRGIVGCTNGRTSTTTMSFASFGALINGDDAAYQQSLVTVTYSTSHACSFGYNGGAFYFYDAPYVAAQGITWSVAYAIDDPGDFSIFARGRAIKTGQDIGWNAFFFNQLNIDNNAPRAGGPTSAGGISITTYNNKAAYIKNGQTISIGALSGHNYSTPKAIATIARPDIVSTIVISG